MTFKTILASGVSWYSVEEKTSQKPVKRRGRYNIVNLPSHIDLFEEARLTIQAMKDRKAQRKQK